MKTAFQMTGLEDYLDSLQRAGEDIDKISREALKEASEILVADMKRRVPVDTWNLFNHITIKVPSAPGHYNYREIGIIYDLAYTDKKTSIQARAVEFGSIHMKAHPFIRPAISANRSRILEIFRRSLKSKGLID